MAPQTDKPKAVKPAPVKKSGSDGPKRGIKNPFIYAGTVVFLVVVIVAFVFFPTSTGASGGGTLTFGSFAGKPISYTQGSYMVREVQAISEANPSSDDSELGNQMRNYQIYRQAFELAAVHEGILDAVRTAGLVIPDQIIDRKILTLGQFQENGAFSTRLYRQMGTSQRLDLRTQLKDDILVQTYANPVYNIKPSSKELEFLGSMAKDTRTVEYALFPLSSFPDSEVLSWAQSNSTLFKRLKLSRITMAKESELKALRAKIEGGLAFADAAKKSSTDSWATQGGDMGLRFFHELQDELSVKTDADAVSALQKSGLSSVLKTSSGAFALYKLEDAAKPADFADPAVLADARSRIMGIEHAKAEDWALAKAKAFAALPAADFAANARRESVEVKSVGPFSLDYGNLTLNLYGQSAPLFTPIPTSGAPELASASRSEKFLTAAFGLAPGAVSEPLILGENVLVLKVKEAVSTPDSGMLAFYYPYLMKQKIDEDVKANFLASPKFKDDFSKVYLKYFTPKTQS
jgi:parvulin-like peptidyl-prolyl isomerase